MAPALGLGLLWGLLGDPGGATKVLHSLRFLDVGVSEPSPGISQYMQMGFVDGIPFEHYDSERGRLEPLTQWIKDGVEPEYWEWGTQIDVGNQHVAARGLEILRERYNQSRGLHTIQWLSGCDLLSDGSIRGSHQIGYDGRDFISFDLESGRFLPADSAAEITRRRWEQEGTEAERHLNYLKHECPELLRKYIGYGQKELERKEPPDVHVSGREEHGTLILSCHAYGFYPNTIAVSWMKGGETLDQETEWGGVVPNSDGTFHTWARIEVLPEEWEQYRCRVEHPGMPEPGSSLGSRHLAGISLWWSLCPSSLPSSSSSSDLASGSSNPGGGTGMDTGSRKGHGNQHLDHRNHCLSNPRSWIQPLPSSQEI